MTEVTLSKPPSSGRGRAFWVGLLLGLLGMFVTVAILWFFGVLDFTGDGADENEANNNTTQELPVVNDIDDAVVNDVTSAEEDETLADLEEESKEESTSQASESPFIASVVTAKDIDEDFKPVGPTSSFSTDDDRIYAIITLTGDIAEGTPVGVDWFLEGTKVSDFSTDVESGQRLVYFFMANQGAGDYSAEILIDGKKADKVLFVVE